VLDLLGLRALADRNVKGLSGGAQQRVAIGRALVRDPDLILFDEPLSHLDADQKVQLRAEIKRLQKLRQVTSILVTHDQTEAIAMADRIAVMNHGVLQQVGAPQDLYERPANLLVANFIGEPPMNLLPVTVEGTRLQGPGWSLPIDDRRGALLAGRPGAAVIAGIRPEHIDLRSVGEPGGARGKISYRECRGDTDVVTILLGDSDSAVVAETSGPSVWRPGDDVMLGIAMDQIHIFDEQSGRNLEVDL
jgi:ABC-type sugar transport system ATPase subunit